MNYAITPLRICCLVALIALSVLALTGGIDRLADDTLENALKVTGGIYATARGINALVSVLQGTELDLPFLTLAVGEVLDPVNDLIERFSTLVLVALGAVAAQKVLLLMVSSDIFNYVFIGIALLTAFGVLTQKASVFSVLLKCFLIAVFVRFSLGIVVIANHWVDATFLDASDQDRHQAMRDFEGDLQDVRNLATQETDLSAQRSAALQAVQRLELQRQDTERQLLAKQAEIAEATSRLDAALQGEDMTCRLSVLTPVLSPTCAASVKPLFNTLRAKEHDKTATEKQMKQLGGELEDERDNLACIDKRAAGEACAVWENIPAAPDIRAIQRQFNDLDQHLGDFTENAWLLLISLLLKSVAIPLLFFYGLLKSTGLIWQADLNRLLR